jgi:hypothetical protein
MQDQLPERAADRSKLLGRSRMGGTCQRQSRRAHDHAGSLLRRRAELCDCRGDSSHHLCQRHRQRLPEQRHYQLEPGLRKRGLFRHRRQHRL